MRNIIILITILLSSTLILGQNSKGDNLLKGGKYFEAIDVFKKEYTKAKGAAKKGEVTYKLAKCYDNMANYEEARKFYERAYNLKYHKTEPDVLLGFAQTKLKLGDYKGAADSFEELLKIDPTNKLGKKGLQSTKDVKAMLAEPTRYKVKNQSALNTESYDWALAQFDKKGEQYIFSSSRQGAMGAGTDAIIGENFTDLFVSRRDKNGKWGEPSPLPEGINTVNHEGAAVMNSKGNTIYFTRCPMEKKLNLGCDIYVAQQQGQNWKPATLIPLKDSVIYSVGHPALSRNEKVLIFSSDMPGGEGGKDLWMSTYDKRAKEWSKPKNLGLQINTPGNEMFPYLSTDGKLYFSSDGHVGMGALDIFEAKSIGENKWGKPKNMGSPINSHKDDYAFVFEKSKTDKGFFTSNREGGKGKDDLYSFELPEDELKLTVKVLAACDIKKDAGEPAVGAKVTLTGSDGSSVTVKTDDKGMFTFDKKGAGRYIKKDVNYTIVVEGVNALIGKDKRSTFGIQGAKNFFHDFKVQRTDCGEIPMPEVRYILNDSAFINDPTISSNDSMMFLYNIMVENPTIVVELDAHTDCRGSDESNMKLSAGRANECVRFLVSKGIDRERLVGKGYGETTPRVLPNGQVLTCDYITPMKTTNPSEYERLHTLNRRTTFKVLRSDYKPKNK